MKRIIATLSLFFLFFAGNAQHHPIVLKINYAYLNFEKIDDRAIYELPFKHFLNARGLAELKTLETQLTGISDFYLDKVFYFLTTKDTVSYSRLGERVTVPPFWATFRMNLPEQLDLKRTLRTLNEFAPLIDYAHYDYPIELASAPNDSLFGLQYALNMDDTLTGINIQSAWDIETGKQFIKVAVHDTGIDTLHPDLNIVFGGAYNPNNYAEAPWGLNEDSHGTGVAGIIGAKRNNAMGIAGVAGGNGSDTSGVSLFDLKIMPNSFGLGSYFMAGVVDAARSVGTYWDYSDIYSIESQNYFNNSPGFGVHIGNHSYTISTEIPTQMPNGRDIPVNDENVDADCQVCREAMLFSLRNGVINVVCRFNGFNTANPPTPVTRIDDLYPQSLPDNWIISVGASGSDGNTVQDGVNQAPNELSFYSLYGGNMDLIAPGSKGNVYTTRATTSGVNYDVFNGTSAAAPYVSGAIGLLLSHYNKACYNRRNLSIEDIEYILEKSTTP